MSETSEKKTNSPHQIKRPKAARSAENPKAGGSEDPKPDKGLSTVIVRNDFYRDGYRTLLKISLIQALIIVGMIAAMFFVVHTHQPENRYFATTEDGRLIPMVSLMEPNLSTPALMSWVAQATTEVMTFNFNDYRRRLQEASRNFTRQGWDSFTLALQKSRIIEMVETNQQVVTAAPRGAPILQSEGIVKGRYQWVVQVPMVISYQSGAKVRTDNLMVTLVIVRVPRLESPNGVGIEQWIAVKG
ncbi:MAG: type IVB secretion system apparatus protein IcmL/DotI [Rhodospirillales bacterium]|nr:type IVB secretion system apparatus protein IcmL/DotI [Rhodospirillales bacterium]